MLTFISLFLGLITGVHPVEVLVAEEVARVEIVLDGTAVGTLTEAPWVLPCDFGELAPHELVAVGYDAHGAEVARTRQLINLPRGLTEAGVILEGGSDGQKGRGRNVRITWQSLYDAQPRAITATLDGTPLPVGGGGQVTLPDHDPEALHFLRAEVDFPSGLTAAAEVVFGGRYHDETHAELMALPVTATGRGKVPPATAMGGWFTVGDEKLPVAAVEKGAGEIVIVADSGAAAGLEKLLATLSRASSTGLSKTSMSGGSLRVPPSPFAALDQSIRVRSFAPYPRVARRGEHTFELFPQAATDFATESWGLWAGLSRPGPPGTVQRLAEAVAVAGLASASHNHRRVVVLLVGETLGPDASTVQPAAVRRYLEQLRVPLIVWQVEGKGGDTPWGPARVVKAKPQWTRAMIALSKALDRQRVVWVEGNPLPHQVSLSAAASGVVLAGATLPGKPSAR